MKKETQLLFETTFGQYLTISEEAYQFLHAHFVELSYAPREIVVEGGGPAKFFYLVLDGVQAIYLIDSKGEKVVLGFSFAGNVSGVYDAFLSGKSSSLFLESITASKMIGITRLNYLKLFELFPEFHQWRTHFIEGILFGRLSREVEIMTLSAKERFDAFVSRCPEELHQIPQKYLASYLNMKPETFSRLRAMRD
ncbi:MAG: Crp/Fnr family transcriptional regulator [Ekhidna sp.]|uniref:Crp/Fnr family transcriptional regulator n=1 Tax=Ekhidna sp. TaxID=2608089 RepID=UPI0032EB6489